MVTLCVYLTMLAATCHIIGAITVTLLIVLHCVGFVKKTLSLSSDVMMTLVDHLCLFGFLMTFSVYRSSYNSYNSTDATLHGLSKLSTTYASRLKSADLVYTWSASIT